MNAKWFLFPADGLVIVWIIKFISSVFAQIDHKSIKSKKKKKIFKYNHRTTVGPTIIENKAPPITFYCNKKCAVCTRDALVGQVVLHIDWVSFFIIIGKGKEYHWEEEKWMMKKNKAEKNKLVFRIAILFEYKNI